jgi:predicted negative regulator of RcsB-dependent stress response
VPQPIKSPAKHPVLDAGQLIRPERVRHWFLANLRTVVTVVGILALVGASWGILKFVQQRAEARAAALYVVAFTTYQEALTPERQLRVLAPDTKEILERAIKEFQAVRDQYPRTAHGALALFHQANALAAIERYDDAIAAYHTWLSTYQRKDLVPLVTQRLAYTLWAKGDTQEALTRFEAVANMPDAPNRDMAYFEKGRLLEQLGQKDKALEAYTALAKEFGASPLSSEGNARIVALGGTPPGAEPPHAQAADATKAPADGPSTPPSASSQQPVPTK